MFLPGKSSHSHPAMPRSQLSTTRSSSAHRADWSLERTKIRGISRGDFRRAAEVGQQDESSIPPSKLEADA